MIRTRILNFIRRSYIHRYLVGFVGVFIIGTLLALFVLYPVRAAYYAYVSGDYLLNVKSVVTEKRVEQDDTLSVAFCRDPRVRIVAVNNIRTFYLDADNTPVYQRNLPDNIAYERTADECQPLSIKVDQRPNELGTYKFCQEFDFYTEFDQKKTAHFCSTSYEVIEPTRTSVPKDTLELK